MGIIIVQTKRLAERKKKQNNNWIKRKITPTQHQFSCNCALIELKQTLDVNVDSRSLCLCPRCVCASLRTLECAVSWRGGLCELFVYTLPSNVSFWPKGRIKNPNETKHCWKSSNCTHTHIVTPQTVWWSSGIEAKTKVSSNHHQNKRGNKYHTHTQSHPWTKHHTMQTEMKRSS